jgi:hypothetical protein
MTCLAGGMKGFALQMPCLAGQTFVPAGQTLVPAFKTLVRAVKTLVPAVKTLVPVFKTKGFFLQKTLFFRIFSRWLNKMQNNLEYWAAFHRI